MAKKKKPAAASRAMPPGTQQIIVNPGTLCSNGCHTPLDGVGYQRPCRKAEALCAGCARFLNEFPHGTLLGGGR